MIKVTYVHILYVLINISHKSKLLLEMLLLMINMGQKLYFPIHGSSANVRMLDYPFLALWVCCILCMAENYAFFSPKKG